MNSENILRFDKYESPLGTLTLESDGEYLTGLNFDRKNGAGIDIKIQMNNIKNNYSEIFDGTKSWLDVYFTGASPDFIPKIRISGTDFQRCVYEVLLTIPFGKVMSYGDLAGIVAAKRGKLRMSAQAVGHANSLNPIGIIVPCHRVVGADGTLVGYAGGLERKAGLLENEGIDVGDLNKYRVRIEED